MRYKWSDEHENRGRRGGVGVTSLPGEEGEKVRSEGKIVRWLLACEFTDHIDGARHDGRCFIRQAALEVVKCQSQTLWVLQIELVQHERRLLADVRARRRQHRDNIAEEVTGEVFRCN